MKSRAFVMLGLALLLAVASVYLARNWLQGQIGPTVAEPAPKLAVTKVVVATAPIQFGNSIRREHLRVVDWPKEALPEGVFLSVDQVLGDGSEERVALKPISKNEPLLKDKVSGFGGRASLSAMISQGMRATTIRVNDVNGVAGFVLPGDRVDILLTRDPSGGKARGGDLITDILLQNMKVLGIDQDANENREKPSVVKAVTLEVTTLQAQKLTLAQKVGTLSLALRNAAEADAINPKTVSLRDLRIGEANDAANITPQTAEKTVAPAPAPKPKKSVVVKKAKTPVSSVRIVRGLEAREYEVKPEKPTFSSPAFSKPLDILPSQLAPKVAPQPSIQPVAGQSNAADSLGGSSSEPISLLRKGSTSKTQ